MKQSVNKLWADWIKWFCMITILYNSGDAGLNTTSLFHKKNKKTIVHTTFI